MHIRPSRSLTLVAVVLMGGMAACSSTKSSSGDAGTTTEAAVTTAPASTEPATTAPASTAPITTPPPTVASHYLYEPVDAPPWPRGHSDAFAPSGVLADGTYFVVYNGGETLMPDITVYQVFTDTECETQAAAHGEECLNGYYVPSDPYRDINDLPFASGLFLSVAHGSTMQSYWITPEELVTIRASSPSGGAPSDYSFVPFPFMMTVVDGEITRFEQLWQP